MSVANGGTTLHSAKYHLLPADLRSPPSESLAPPFTLTLSSTSGGPLLSPDLPTLLLFESVLVYVAPETSSTDSASNARTREGRSIRGE